ncbi:glycosyltransferase family 9 protein [Aegicerativicinus sediminis]|uniref:glycosyltransferase family 9 protein n=1 Tax=Aegicerativicinus sediminis TaxID=2893202 RepID=UPI001E2A0DB4|nr:glycosyltransferase family 9 protein [Aegicerativicinus sediminis]
MKILIIQQKMIGDVLMSTILFEAIKKKYPNYELHYLINTHTEPVVRNNPFIDKILFYSPEIEGSKRQFLKFLLGIRDSKYSAVIDVYGKLPSLLFTEFSGTNLKIGFLKSYTKSIYTHSIKRTKIPSQGVSLAIENRLKLLEPLDIAFENISPKLYVSSEEKEDAREFLLKGGLNLEKPVLMVSAIGSIDSKTYPLNYMAEVLNDLVRIRPDFQIVFNYIPSQLQQAQELYNLCKKETQEKIYIELYCNSLRHFISVLTQCRAIIGNEGGAINIAKALNIPSFTIFSPHIGKKNWHGKAENEKNVAIHLEDYISKDEFDKKSSKKQFDLYYSKLKPELFSNKLEDFLKSL